MKLFTTTTRCLETIFKHRHLCYQMAVRNIQMQYRGSYLGAVWTILSPLLMLGIYTFVFGYVFGGAFKDETPIEHALGIFVGLTVHNFIAEMMVAGPQLVTGNPTFVKKVVFPLEVLITAKIASSLLTLAIKTTLILTAALILGKPLSLNLFALIPHAIMLLLLVHGIGMLASSIGVFVKDISNASQFLSMALLFGSAIFYPAAKIPEEAWNFLQFNPLISIVESARSLILWNTTPSLQGLAIPMSVCIVLFTLGNYCFYKLRPAFSDVI